MVTSAMPTSNGLTHARRRAASPRMSCIVVVLLAAALSRNAEAQAVGGAAQCYQSLRGAVPRRPVRPLTGNIQRLDVDLDGDRTPEHIELTAGPGNSVSLTVRQGAETRQLGVDVTRRLGEGESIACATLTARDLTHDGTPELIVATSVDGGDFPRDVVHIWQFAPGHAHAAGAASHGDFAHTEFRGSDNNIVRRDGTIRAVVGSQGMFRDLVFRADRFYLFNSYGAEFGFSESGPLMELPEPPGRPARR